MFLSDTRLKHHIIDLLLFCIVILSWGYTIYAGKIVSERHMHTLNLEPISRDTDLSEKQLQHE